MERAAGRDMRYAMLCFVLGCTTPDAGDLPGTSSSSIDPTMRIETLDRANRSALCAWSSERLGGAGREESCAECDGDACVDWTATVNSDEACLEIFDAWVDCDATVEDFQRCINAHAPDLCGDAGMACAAVDRC